LQSLQHPSLFDAEQVIPAGFDDVSAVVAYTIPAALRTIDITIALMIFIFAYLLLMIG
jgi:hypothetical protein